MPYRASVPTSRIAEATHHLTGRIEPGRTGVLPRDVGQDVNLNSASTRTARGTRHLLSAFAAEDGTNRRSTQRKDALAVLKLIPVGTSKRSLSTIRSRMSDINSSETGEE